MTDENKPNNEWSPEIGSTHDEFEGQDGSCPNFDAPAFLDDEGPSDVIPQGIYVTVRDEKPHQSTRSEIESAKRLMQLTQPEIEALLKDMKESSAWM